MTTMSEVTDASARAAVAGPVPSSIETSHASPPRRSSSSSTSVREHGPATTTRSAARRSRARVIAAKSAVSSAAVGSTPTVTTPRRRSIQPVGTTAIGTSMTSASAAAVDVHGRRWLPAGSCSATTRAASAGDPDQLGDDIASHQTAVHGDPADDLGSRQPSTPCATSPGRSSPASRHPAGRRGPAPEDARYAAPQRRRSARKRPRRLGLRRRRSEPARQRGWPQLVLSTAPVRARSRPPSSLSPTTGSTTSTGTGLWRSSSRTVRPSGAPTTCLRWWRPATTRSQWAACSRSTCAAEPGCTTTSTGTS